MGHNLIETLMGALVLAVGAAFFGFAYTQADLGAPTGYDVSARFDQIDGIRPGSEVRLAGIKIGTVTRDRLDPQTYFAVVEMNIDPSVKLPVDTSAKITSEGLLGDKYISLTPGGSEQMIRAGGEIQHTQGSIDLIGLVGQAIFGQAGKEGKKEGAGGLE